MSMNIIMDLCEVYNLYKCIQLQQTQTNKKVEIDNYDNYVQMLDFEIFFYTLCTLILRKVDLMP